MDKVDSINMCIPVASAIIERLGSDETEILVQRRWKPERDPIYSGTLDIPAGWIDRYENVFTLQLGPLDYCLNYKDREINIT